MGDWATPVFDSLPEVPGVPGLRWMGSTMMDRRTYEAEGWHCREFGGTTYWRGNLRDLEQEALRTASERSRRKALWAARQEGDPAHQAWIESLVRTQP